MGHKRKAEDKKKQKTGDRKKKSKKDEKKSKKSKKKDKKSSKKKGANPSSVNMKQVRPIVSFAQTPPPSSHRRRHHRKEGGDINSPDDVAVLMGRADDKGKVTVHIQLDSTGNHTIRSFFRGIWESTLKSLQEIRRKKYTLLYIASLVIDQVLHLLIMSFTPITYALGLCVARGHMFWRSCVVSDSYVWHTTNK